MRLAILALAAALAFQPVFAKKPSQSYSDKPNESQLLEHGSYQNSDGQTVHSPAHSKTGKAPAGASARCGDGTYSFSTHRRGTCSHHGGVASWL
ncbi:DUF3761 domain-containing protein, partial [Chromobacterium subtsugae]|uniref:DUF3761 domain-containing protein n=1 Tax=Chromobacterium subtsugae TaxID=251747 RepID=UPI00064178D4